MPWDKNNYPNSMNNLDPRIREKAIETGNALLEKDSIGQGVGGKS